MSDIWFFSTVCILMSCCKFQLYWVGVNATVMNSYMTTLSFYKFFDILHAFDRVINTLHSITWPHDSFTSMNCWPINGTVMQRLGIFGKMLCINCAITCNFIAYLSLSLSQSLSLSLSLSLSISLSHTHTHTVQLWRKECTDQKEIKDRSTRHTAVLYRLCHLDYVTFLVPLSRSMTPTRERACL